MIERQSEKQQYLERRILEPVIKMTMIRGNSGNDRCHYKRL